MIEDEDLYLEVSKEFVKKSQGFAIDIGGSAIKIAYVRNDDWDKLMKDQITTAKVRLILYGKEAIEDALQFVKDNCYIPRGGATKPVIYMTGGGCQQYGTLIEKQLDITIKMLWEQWAVARAICYLSESCPQTQFEHLLDLESRAATLSAAEGMAKSMLNYKIALSRLHNDKARVPDINIDSVKKIIEAGHSDLPVSEIFPDFFPCIRFQVSSASGHVAINSDGTFHMLTTVYPGGRSFVALGQMICGSKKTYDELIDMAEKGSNLKVDQTWSELTSSRAEAAENSHLHALDLETLYVLGHAAAEHPDAFKKEDLIRGILHMFARYQTAMLHNMNLRLNAKHVVAVGSFFNRHLVRSVFAQEFVRQKVMLGYTFNGEGMDVHLHFVKMCAHLGNLGALIASTEQNVPYADNPYQLYDKKPDNASEDRTA